LSWCFRLSNFCNRRKVWSKQNCSSIDNKQYH
jgi:hypothetical protein